MIGLGWSEQRTPTRKGTATKTVPTVRVADSTDATLGAQVVDGFETYHVMNPHDDGIGFDEYVDWLIEAGCPIQRIGNFGEWVQRFETALRALPDRQREHSVLEVLLLLLRNSRDLQPAEPSRGAFAPAERFRAAVQEAKIGPDNDIPHVSAPVIIKLRHRLATARTALARLKKLQTAHGPSTINCRPVMFLRLTRVGSN